MKGDHVAALLLVVGLAICLAKVSADMRVARNLDRLANAAEKSVEGGVVYDIFTSTKAIRAVTRFHP